MNNRLIAAMIGMATMPMAAVAQSGALTAPTPDSLARLVMTRFASATPEAFDSVNADPLARDVVRTAVQQRNLRRADLQRVVW